MRLATRALLTLALLALPGVTAVRGGIQLDPSLMGNADYMAPSSWCCRTTDARSARTRPQCMPAQVAVPGDSSIFISSSSMSARQRGMMPSHSSSACRSMGSSATYCASAFTRS